MGKLPGLALLAACLAGGCGEEAVFLGLPPLEGYRSAILIFDEAGVAHQVAFDTDTPVTTRAQTEEIFSLAYDETLDELGIVEGELPLARVTNCALLEPDRLMRAKWSASAELTWEEIEVSDLPAMIPRNLVEDPARCDRCPAITYELREPEYAGKVKAAVARPDGTILMTTTRGIYRLDENLDITEIPTSSTTPTFGIALAPDGSVWLSGDDGTLARGDPETGFEIVVRGMPVADERVLLVDPESGDLYVELFLGVDGLEGGELYRVTPQYDVERIADWSPSKESAQGLLWRPSDGLWALGRLDHIIIRRGLDGTMFTDELPGPHLPESELTAIADVPGLGVVVGSDLGEFSRRADGGWESLESMGTGIRLRSISPLEDGVVIYSSEGSIDRYITGLGFMCEPIQTPTHTHRGTVPFKDGALFFTQQGILNVQPTGSASL